MVAIDTVSQRAWRVSLSRAFFVQKGGHLMKTYNFSFLWSLRKMINTAPATKTRRSSCSSHHGRYFNNFNRSYFGTQRGTTQPEEAKQDKKKKKD
jgi:hypothetical protein